MEINRMSAKRAAALCAMAASVFAAQGTLADDAGYIRAKWEKHRQLTGEDLFATASSDLSPKSSLTIENLCASQRAGTKMVDVYYDLLSSGNYQCNVSISMTDNGSPVAVNTYAQDGDIGEGVVPGTGKHIAWDEVRAEICRRRRGRL